MRMVELSKAELLSELEKSVRVGRQADASTLRFLAEVEQRRVHLEEAYESLQQFCEERLRMSEDEAWRRITAARIANRLPFVFSLLESGDLTLTALLEIREHLDGSDDEEIVRAACGKSKAKVRAMLAARFPKSDVLPTVLELPAVPPSVPKGPSPAKTGAANSLAARAEPLSAKSYQVQFTASEELRAKLERATDLMRHRNPTGDLAVLVGAALDDLIAKLERETRAKASKPPPARRRPAQHGYVPRHVRREVFERDGERCAYESASGRRCSARGHLEIEHLKPRAMGGSGEEDNLAVYCRNHNQLSAEKAFGRETIASYSAGAARGDAGAERGVPRQRGEPDGADIVLDALVKMGFKPGPVKRALRDIAIHDPRERSPSELAQSALRLLT